jgi:F-type H+-transporting ATPase subunit alpha
LEVISKYEAGLYPFIENKHPQVFAQLAKEKKITDDLDKAMAKALSEYEEEFKDTIK